MKKLSVLITTYQCEEYVEQTLDSVLMQEIDFEMEILVGDDGSSDRTAEIVSAYEKKHPEISLFVRERDPEVAYHRVERSSDNRLELLERASGEYCIFLDGDDFYTDPNKLRRQVNALDKHPECSMCAHNVWLYYSEENKTPLCRAKKERVISFPEYWKIMYIQANAVMFRNLYREHTPKGALRGMFDDNNIVFWLFQYGKMYYLPDILLAYRQSPASSWNGIDELKKAASNILGYAIELQISPDTAAVSETRHYPEILTMRQQSENVTMENLGAFYDMAVKLDLQPALAFFEHTASAKKELDDLCRRAGRRYRMARIGRGIRKILGQY